MATNLQNSSIPNGWRLAKLGEVADVSFSPVDKKTAEDETSVRLCNYTDVFYNRQIRPDMQFMEATANATEIERWNLKRGDVLFTKDSETADEIGIPSHVVEDMPGVLCGYHLGLARPQAAIADGGFLAETLRAPVVATQFSRAANGVTRFGLTLGATHNIQILLPPLHEQRRIAKILDSIDEAIERAESVITSTEQLRDALLHDLLTKGAPNWHTEWKDAPNIGQIPACWEVARLGDVATLQRGVDLPVQDRLNGSIPVYGSNGILDHHANTSQNGPGVITGRSGSIGLVYYSEGPYWPLNTTLYVRDFHGNSERFIYHFLGHIGLERFAASTGVPSLNRNFVHPYLVALPPLPEQQAIAEALDGVESTIELARTHVSILRSVKESAADALLTGKVRVAGEVGKE